MRRIDDAIARAIERALKRRREAPEPFRPKGRMPSGGWSWETYRRDVERVIKDSARRRGAPDPFRRQPRPARSKRELIKHPFPPPDLSREEAEQIEREVFEGARPEPMPPLPRTAESRGFGDIKHSFPRPAPEALPPPVPEIAIPPISAPAPAPVPTSSPTSSPSSRSLPGVGVAAGVLAAIGVAAVVQSRSRTRQETRSATTPALATPPQTQTVTPTATPIPTPTPTPVPSSPPAPPLTPTKTPSAELPREPARCKTPAEQRKDDRKRRKEKRKECKQFLSVRVPAHKRKMCIADMAKYLYRKAQRTAKAAIRKKIIAELEERGVNAKELLKLTRRPRRPKAEIEVGGVEIDFEDLIGGK
jgi:hypothetical protein